LGKARTFRVPHHARQFTTRPDGGVVHRPWIQMFPNASHGVHVVPPNELVVVRTHERLGAAGGGEEINRVRDAVVVLGDTRAVRNP
jgi:hypothetical protein